ncbi:YihY/virulence factor BrkB family protein [Microbacterium lacus]|uniref:YihY/virulence factor BrkB family protein n=1 Tax=Microbacterium lacus TaxID=415217 RepID=UPI00384C2D1D
MSTHHQPASPEEAHSAALKAANEEETLRQRWEETQDSLRVRFEQPISRATVATERVLGWFPVRVWRHFLQHNGFLLAAGVSYQALFAIFASVYVAFAMAGLWLGGSTEAINAMIELINSYLPGLISDDGSGLFTTQQVTAIATGSASTLAITGAIALITAMWTAIGFVTFARRAVRDIFGIPPDRRSYFLLKARDLLAAVAFGVALVLGFSLTSLGTWALNLIFSLFGWNTATGLYELGVRVSALAVTLALYTATLAALVKFLTGVTLHWRQIWPGAALGGAAITVLQIGAGWLLIYTPSNPLLATFAIFIGLLLWFRIIGVIILVASAWIAVAANDRDMPLVLQTEAERLAEEHRALLLAAEVRLRTAESERAVAPWFRIPFADRAVRQAENELDQVRAAAPPAPAKRGSLLE